MEAIFGPIILIIVLVWAFRLEIGIAKANEALTRIESQLSGSNKKEKQ